MWAIDVRLLGRLEVSIDGRTAALAGTKQRSVLAMLALDAQRVVATDLLLDQIWGEGAPPGARRSLQVYVSNLRKTLGAGASIESLRDGYILQIDLEQVDVFRFARLAKEGRAALVAGDALLASGTFRAALDLWRGPPLADFTYETFANPHVERLEQERLAVLEDRIGVDLALGRHALVVRELADLVADHPLRESVRAKQMLALYRCGRQADALVAYQAGREVLLEELGIDPSRELQELERAILDHDPAIDAPAPVESAPDDATPMRAVAKPTSSVVATNVPVQVTSFVGRELELAEIQRLLAASRLVTLTGPGGAGKTRLSFEVAAKLASDFRDGAWVVELAPLADPELVASKIAAALGVGEDASRPLLDTLVEAVRERELLVVLDNCEHVIDAAAKAADVLVRSCPGLKLLATSREPLRIAPEQSFRVPSLGLPSSDEIDVAELAASEAVRLFAERAAQHQPRFAVDATNAALVARVCHRLDGIPLAIELTAARVRSLSVADIEAHLDQRFRLLTTGPRTATARQQTLRASIDWSWDLLTAAEQTVLSRLGVFAGGWDLDAAESVASTEDTEAWEVLEHLGTLVDKSLVQADETTGTVRYRLLETVRDYVTARLSEVDAERLAVGARHRDHYLGLAETATQFLLSHGQAEWLDQLDMEHDNLRAALAFSLTDPDPVPGLRLAVALWWFWLFRGYAIEGVEALTALLGRADTQSPDLSRGRALVTLAGLLADSNNDDAGAIAEAALAIGEAQHDDPLIADALSMLSWVRYRQGDLDGTLQYADLGLSIARALGNTYLTARLLSNRGGALNEQGDAAGARACFQEARDLFRQAGNRIQASWVLSNLAYSQLTDGDLDAARANLTDALANPQTGRHNRAQAFAAFNLGLVELLDENRPRARELFELTVTSARSMGDPASVADGLFGLALTTPNAQPERAATIHGAADAVREQLGMVLEQLEAGLRDADHARLRKELGKDTFERHYAIGREAPRDDVISLALE